MGAAAAAAGAAACMTPSPRARPLAAAAGVPSKALPSSQSLVRPARHARAAFPRHSAFQGARRHAAGPRASLAEATYAGDGAATADGAARAGRGATFQGNETVAAVMTSMVVVATPDTTVGDILEHFAFYTGLPVVDARTLQCVGMITNIDMYRKQRGKATSVASTLVREVMISPVVAVYPDTLVSYAAGLMLRYKVHRLPVVDRELRVVGIVTNEDLFQTLMASDHPPSDSFRMVP